MNDMYILDGKKIVPCDLMTWAKWFEKANRHVARTVEGEVKVSTVFLGIDHAFGDGPPLLFETMIFGGQHNQYQERCSTWEEAEAMHKAACEQAGVPYAAEGSDK